jgi:hypothetical protein
MPKRDRGGRPTDLEQQMQHGRHDEQRHNLHRWLLAPPEDDGLALSLTRSNTELYEYLRRWGCSYEDFDAHAGERARRKQKNRGRYEVILCVLVRTLHADVIPYFTVLLSLYALKCRISSDYFDLLSSLGLLMGRTWVRALAKELGDIVVHPRSYMRNFSRWVGKVVYDNLMLRFNTDYESHLGEYCRKHHQTTQWTSVPLSHVDDTAVARDFHYFGGWNDRGGNIRVVEHLDSPLATTAYTNSIWAHSMASAVNVEPAAALYHPNHTPLKSERAVDHAHIPTESGTGSYRDNEITLARIYNRMITVLGLKYVFVVGDHTLYASYRSLDFFLFVFRGRKWTGVSAASTALAAMACTAGRPVCGCATARAEAAAQGRR